VVLRFWQEFKTSEVGFALFDILQNFVSSMEHLHDCFELTYKKFYVGQLQQRLKTTARMWALLHATAPDHSGYMRKLSGAIMSGAKLHHECPSGVPAMFHCAIQELWVAQKPVLGKQHLPALSKKNTTWFLARIDVWVSSLWFKSHSCGQVGKLTMFTYDIVSFD